MGTKTQDKIRPRCVFSTKFCRKGYPDELHAVDWRFGNKKGWSESWSDRGRLRWYPQNKGLSEHGKVVILDKFGLLGWKSQYLKKIAWMSPAQLIRERRKKEDEIGLACLRVFNDNIGEQDLPAEMYY